MVREIIIRHARQASQWSAIALGASIPVSTALDNFLIALTLAAWAFSGQVRATARITLINPVALLSVSLYLLLMIGIVYGDASRQEALSCLSKYADLLCIPVLIMIFRMEGIRARALYALAFSLVGIIILSYLIRFGLLPKLPFISGTVSSPTVLKLKLTHNLLVAFGAVLFLWLGYTSHNPRMRIFWYGFALLAVINVIFMVQGATGYLVLVALSLFAVWKYLGKRETVGTMLVISAVLVIGISIPSAFHERLNKIKMELQDWRADDKSTTSTGLRLEFYQNSLAIAARHPLTGVGTGGFPRAYAAQVAGTGKAETHNPHNEFLHLAVQVGVLGAILLVALFVFQWRLAARLPTPMYRGLARGLIITMVIGCMLNSFLLDHTEGLFYAWLTGLLYGGLQYDPHDKSSAPT